MTGELSLADRITLNDGVRMPRFGLGVYTLKQKGPVGTALKLGYRLLDTATYYGNEEFLGNEIRDSNIPREDVFVVTKLWNDEHGTEKAENAVKSSLKRLDLGYIDLYLIHTPLGGKLVETYTTLLKFKEEKLIRSVGVSNFGVHHLEGLKAAGLPAPSVNQIELHPWQLHRKMPIIEYCQEHKIAVMGFSPLMKNKRSEEPTAANIGKRYNKTWAQVLIRWSVQRGYITIPRSSNPERIKENADIFDFSLSEEEMQTLNSMPDFSCTWDPTQHPWEDFSTERK